MHYLLDVQTGDHVFGQDEGSANHHLVHVLTGQGHQHSLLSTLQRELITTVVTDHLVFPDAHVQEVTCFLGAL